MQTLARIHFGSTFFISLFFTRWMRIYENFSNEISFSHARTQTHTEACDRNESNVLELERRLMCVIRGSVGKNKVNIFCKYFESYFRLNILIDLVNNLQLRQSRYFTLYFAEICNFDSQKTVKELTNLQNMHQKNVLENSLFCPWMRKSSGKK